MAARLGTHVRSNLVGYVALFIALGGTGAWAVDKITSKEIAKKAIRSKHLGKEAVRSKHIKDAEVKTQDIDPAVLAGLGGGTTVAPLVEGDARLISAHDSYAPQESRLLLDIPGLGQLHTECRTAPVAVASMFWRNTTGSGIEFASERRPLEAGVVPNGDLRGLGAHAPTQPATDNQFGQASLALGTGAARTTAIVHAVPVMLTPGGTCSFQAHVILTPSG